MTTSQISKMDKETPPTDQALDLFGLNPMEGFVADNMGAVISRLQDAYSEEWKARGLTRTAISKEMNVDRSQISHILQGRRNITLRTLFELLFCMGREAEINFPPVDRKAGNGAKTVGAVSGGEIECDAGVADYLGEGLVPAGNSVLKKKSYVVGFHARSSELRCVDQYD